MFEDVDHKKIYTRSIVYIWICLVLKNVGDNFVYRCMWPFPYHGGSREGSITISQKAAPISRNVSQFLKTTVSISQNVSRLLEMCLKESWNFLKLRVTLLQSRSLFYYTMFSCDTKVNVGKTFFWCIFEWDGLTSILVQSLSNN